MGAKFYCNECGMEVFKGMEQVIKETTTIAEVEKTCICTDCSRPADKAYTTKADFWGDGEIEEIRIKKRGKSIFVNKRRARMRYNGIQLRFELLENKGTYIIFDDKQHRHNPPCSIKEMFKSLSN